MDYWEKDACIYFCVLFILRTKAHNWQCFRVKYYYLLAESLKDANCLFGTASFQRDLGSTSKHLRIQLCIILSSDLFIFLSNVVVFLISNPYLVQLQWSTKQTNKQKASKTWHKRLSSRRTSINMYWIIRCQRVAF